MRTPIAALALAVLFVSSAAAAAVPRRVDVAKGPIAAAIDRQLTDAAENRRFGGAVVIEVKGEVIVQGGWGYADRALKEPFTADTSAQIGSITKSFTALAASQLAAQGKLDLNVPVRTYLKDAPEPAGSATLDQLMTHTAGLDDYCGEDFDRRTRAELVSVCMAKPLTHARGTYAYSNMGLSMAAAAVEAAAGQRWEDYLRDHVWRPFGMTHTGWTFQERTDARFAFGYDKGIAEHPIANKIAALDGADWNLKGNGGIQASANDMRRYYKGVMGQPKAVKDLMLTAHAKEEPGVLAGYGLAFRTDDAGKVYRIGHGGSDGVFFSYLAIYPEQNAFMYFVGNNGEEPVKDELKGVLKILQDAIGATPKPAS